MHFRSLGLLAAALAALACAQPASAQTATSLQLKDATGATVQEGGVNDTGGRFYPGHLVFGWTGTALKALNLDVNGNPTVNLTGTLPAFGATPTFNLGALNGAATAAGVAAVITALGTPAQAGGKIDTVINGTATDRGQSVTSATAVTLMAANASRRGLVVQVQTNGPCYLNGTATATADYHSLQIGTGNTYESSPQHVGTGAVTLICPAATSGAPASVYAREF